MKKIMNYIVNNVQEYGMDFLTRTAILFMVIILMESKSGSISKEIIQITLLEAGILTLVGMIIWNLRKVNVKLKWILHYVVCFLMVMGINLILNLTILTWWSIEKWLWLGVWYTCIYIGLSYIYILQGKAEAKRLNKDLANFKKRRDLED